MFFHHFFLKADRAKFSANPSLVQQNLTHYRSKVISRNIDITFIDITKACRFDINFFF
jgi:hypothetical protein